MNVKISKISLTVFLILLVLAEFLLFVAGEYWPWYAIMSVFAVVPLIAGPNRYRIAGAVALGLSIILITSDVKAGKHYRARFSHQITAKPFTNRI
ncbi:MAG TPA: hypothetical protein VFM25_13180 [Verrucomicrobiae bacterium]|nr:hypothetical protein [Verrucomicrobiae bacterium]